MLRLQMATPEESRQQKVKLLVQRKIYFLKRSFFVS